MLLQLSTGEKTRNDRSSFFKTQFITFLTCDLVLLNHSFPCFLNPAEFSKFGSMVHRNLNRDFVAGVKVGAFNGVHGGIV